MTRIFVNLKRFDVPRSLGGLCPYENPKDWVTDVIEQSVKAGLGAINDLALTYLLPESLILAAVEALKGSAGNIAIGAQSVYRADVAPGGNFGAFTSNRPAGAMKALGAAVSMIAHSEERKDILETFSFYDAAVATDEEKAARANAAVDQIMGQEAKAAFARGLDVIFCVGETAMERGEGEFLPRAEEVDDPSFAPGLKSYDGLDVFPDIIIPHAQHR